VNRAGLINAVLDFPWPLRAYEAWRSQHPVETGDYLFTQPRVRLRPHDDDLLAIPRHLSVELAGELVCVRTPDQQQAIALPKVTQHDAEAILSALRSNPTVIELPYASGAAADVCERVLETGFGRFIYAPRALERLESACSAAEIVRFPGSPYEIVRNYWLNVGGLSRTIEDSLDQSLRSDAFLDWLRSLHVQLLLGSDLQTFYCPPSPVAVRRVEPGSLYTIPTRTLSTAMGEFILDGPRINASAVGGPQYDWLLARSLGSPPAGDSSRTFVLSGTNWGRSIQARGRGEDAPREWYLPPRPLDEQHWDELFCSWKAAVAARTRSEAIPHLGRFHWCFVHMHPFSCANQSLGFLLVNWVLGRVSTSGIPHLILDQLALRHDCGAYVRLFARAVGHWTTSELDPASRHLERVHKRRLLDDFVDRLAAAPDRGMADKVAGRDPDSARLALLVDDAL